MFLIDGKMSDEQKKQIATLMSIMSLCAQNLSKKFDQQVIQDERRDAGERKTGEAAG